jgi:glycosyltransferase involved in cell wall biosynthesis
MARSNRFRRILYLQYTNPCGYPPLLHSSEILAKRGWEVLFLGTQAHGFLTPHPPNRPGVRFQYLEPGASRWKRKVHYPLFCLWCIVWNWRWRPAWIYASDLPACLPAMLLHAFAGARIIYHEHDSPGVPAGSGESRLMRIFRWARRRTANIAEFCILPNENRAKYFLSQARTLKQVNVIWNTPLRNEASPQRERPNDTLKLLYHGSISPVLLPTTVLEAIKKAGYPVVLRIAGYETISSAGYTVKLKRLAADLGISDCLEFAGLLQRGELMDHCRTGDVGLAIIPPSANDRNLIDLIGASNKVFDYMACGLALIVPQTSDWQAFLSYGVACDPTDADSIAQVLRYFYEHPAEMRLMGERGRQRILEQWNYETGFHPVLELLET